MNPTQPRNLQRHLTLCRTRVAQERESNEPRQLSTALTDLGLALFRTREFEEGQTVFEEVRALATSVDDPQFQARIFALIATAYQDIGRYHNAYEIVDEIVQLAEAHNDRDMQCAAMTTQAKILIDSGEPVMALERLNMARQIADVLDDKSHLMKIHEVLGNHKIAIAALDEAQTHFEMAAMVAVQLGDQQAECNYLINKGTVLTWQKNFAQAVTIFNQVLALADELNNEQSEQVALRYLTENLHKTGDIERIPALAHRGIILAQAARDSESVFYFYQTLIMAHYRSSHYSEAHNVLQNAIDYAHTISDLDKEIDMLLNLGESCIVFALHNQALDAYQRALTGIRQVGRATDEAHVIGRLGVVLAELGQTEQAIDHHLQAAEMAQSRKLPELQGEQLIMLALAYLEQQDPVQARNFCEQAIDVYTVAGLDAQATSARELLAGIDVSA